MMKKKRNQPDSQKNITPTDAQASAPGGIPDADAPDNVLATQPQSSEEKQAAEGEVSPKAAAQQETVPLERLLRLQADFENYRKRVARDRAELDDRANENLITELLPVLDNFDIALCHSSEQSADKATVEGFRIVAEQLESTLRKFGLEPLEAEGVEFDPHQHEAVAHLPDGECPEGMVTAQTRRGYRLGGKLLRAAQVVVSNGPPADSVFTQEEEG